MQIFTGIDIVENERIKKAIDNYGTKFVNKIFSEEEIKYCFSKKEFIPCFAARFAVKEAFVKAFYQAFGINLPYKSIKVLGNTSKPATVLLHHNDQSIKSQINRIKYTFSLSHEKNYSVATVIIYIP